MGINRYLVMLTAKDSEAHAHGGEPIWLNDKLAGHTTSGTFGHSVGCTVMMGYINCHDTKLEKTLSNGNFEVEIACRRFPAQASLEAPYDPKGVVLEK